MIVVDASAALSALFNDGAARRVLGLEQLHVPHLIDSEVASGLRPRDAGGQVTVGDGWTALDRWRPAGMTRYAVLSLLDRVWELRDKVAAYDASYVALAEVLNCPLLTADSRLSRAPGLRCLITLVPG